MPSIDYSVRRTEHILRTAGFVSSLGQHRWDTNWHLLPLEKRIKLNMSDQVILQKALVSKPGRCLVIYQEKGIRQTCHRYADSVFDLGRAMRRLGYQRRPSFAHSLLKFASIYSGLAKRIMFYACMDLVGKSFTIRDDGFVDSFTADRGRETYTLPGIGRLVEGAFRGDLPDEILLDAIQHDTNLLD